MRLRRSISSTARKSPTDLSMPACTSSTTSRPTRRGSPNDRAAWRRPSAEPRRGAVGRDRAAAERAVGGRRRRSTAGSSRSRPTMPARCTSRVCSPISRRAGDEAVALIERSLELEPDRADWYSNLGIVLQDRLEAGRGDRRVRARDCARPGSRQRAQQPRRRASSQGKGGRGGSGVSSRHSHRSRARRRVPQPRRPAERPERQREAALCFSKVITLRPKHPEARRLLALAYYTLGEVDKAVEVFEDWLREEPDEPIARHMLAACSGRDVPPRASDAYVERTFDSFAASFDAKLAKLSVSSAGAGGGDARGRGPRRIPKPRRARRRMRHRALRAARSRRMRGTSSGSTCLEGCWQRRAPGTSTTSWPGVN